MNFKKWLENIEESARGTVNRPTNNSVVDRSALYGLAAQFGHSGTQLPVSMDYRNKAAASLAAGVGSSINREFERSGRSIVTPPNIAKMPSFTNKIVKHGSLPLQLPKIFMNPKDKEPRYILNTFNKNLFQKVIEIIPDPMRDPRVIKIGEEPSNSKFILPKQEDFVELEQAKAFARALIHITIYNSLSEEEKERYNIKNPKVEAEGIRDGNLIVAFSFSPRNDIPDEIKNQELDL
jgi:hypothetical protein